MKLKLKLQTINNNEEILTKTSLFLCKPFTICKWESKKQTDFPMCITSLYLWVLVDIHESQSKYNGNYN